MGGTGVQMAVVIRWLNAGMQRTENVFSRDTFDLGRMRPVKNFSLFVLKSPWLPRFNVKCSGPIIGLCIKWAMGPILFTKYTKYRCDHSQISETHLLFFILLMVHFQNIHACRYTHPHKVSQNTRCPHLSSTAMKTECEHTHLQSRRSRRWFDVLRARHYVHSFIWTHSWGWIMMRRYERSAQLCLLAESVSRQSAFILSLDSTTLLLTQMDIDTYLHQYTWEDLFLLHLLPKHKAFIFPFATTVPNFSYPYNLIFYIWPLLICFAKYMKM